MTTIDTPKLEVVIPELRFPEDHVEGSTEGYAVCDQNHAHWGLAGAAGLLLVNHDGENYNVLLQHRSPEVHEGDCWSVPGGALDHDESPLEGALRETEEEIGALPLDYVELGSYVIDHGGWSYTTVVVSVSEMWEPDQDAYGWESGEEGASWFPVSELDSLELHSGLTAALPHLLKLFPS